MNASSGKPGPIDFDAMSDDELAGAFQAHLIAKMRRRIGPKHVSMSDEEVSAEFLAIVDREAELGADPEVVFARSAAGRCVGVLQIAGWGVLILFVGWCVMSILAPGFVYPTTPVTRGVSILAFTAWGLLTMRFPEPMFTILDHMFPGAFGRPVVRRG